MCDRLFLQTEFLQMREKVRCKFSYCSCLIVLILNTAVVGRLARYVGVRLAKFKFSSDCLCVIGKCITQYSTKFSMHNQNGFLITHIEFGGRPASFP